MSSWIPNLSRRLFIASLGIGALFILGLVNKADVGLHISTICMAVAAANSFEKSKTKEKDV